MISVGIDISKDKSTVCMLRPYGEVVEAPYSIAHTEQALNALIERIKSFDEDVKVVLEVFTNYWDEDNPCLFLVKAIQYTE